MLIPELNESYVITVMGYSKYQLNEGQYSIAFQQDLLLEYDVLKKWVKKGSEWIGDNVSGAVEKVKDIAYDAVDAVKDYGSNMKGVIVGLTAMIQDEEEFVKYQRGILASVRMFPKRLKSKINDIAAWLENKNMPTFAKTLRTIKDGVMKLWSSIRNNSSWKGALSMMAFGLGTVYLEEEFEVIAKLSKAQDIIKDPKKVVKGALLDFFTGKVEEATDEIKEELMAFLNEKLGFVEKIKTFIQEKILNVVGKALEQFAGPVAWVKQLMEFFQQSDWVLKNLAEMLQQFSIEGVDD